jgi:hypothetical protein
MPFPALPDTCVLYPAYLCDTLLRLAEPARTARYGPRTFWRNCGEIW